MSGSHPAAVVVVGATSSIGRAIVRRLAERGHVLVLAGRDVSEVERVAADVRVRARARVRIVSFDADGSPDPVRFLDDAVAGEPFAGLVVAHGMLDPVEAVVDDPARVDRLARVNFVSAAALAEVAATRLAAAGGGFVCVLSSVAGDVGRRTNYPYGASKAALSTYLEGLRGRVGTRGVRVVTVKPGFVDTAMTWGLVDPGSPMVARADAVARAAIRGIDRGRRVVYAPAYWRFILAALRALPEGLRHRLPI